MAREGAPAQPASSTDTLGPPASNPARSQSEFGRGIREADTVVCLVSSVVPAVGVGKALATDKISLQCTLKEPQVGAANAFVIDNPAACKSQKLYDRLAQAALDSQGSTC